MKYGICSNTEDYSWNISHGTMPVGDESEMYTNMSLVRTQSIKQYGRESSLTHHLNSLIDISDFCVNSFSISLRAKEIYYWRPKETRVGYGEVINYNAPCNDWDEARELRGCQGQFSCNGLGDPSCATQDKIVRLADTVMRASQGVDGFTLKSDAHQFAIKSWESSSLGGSLSTPLNMRDEHLSSISISVAGLDGVADNFFVMTTKVQMFTDIEPRVVRFNSISDILKSRANVRCS